MRMASIDNQFIVHTHNNQFVEIDTDKIDISVEGQSAGALLEYKDPAKIECQEQTKDDILHGYLPDSS
jgi:hypothetical protein